MDAGVTGLGLAAIEMPLLAEQSDQPAPTVVGVEFVVGDDVAHPGLLVVGLRPTERGHVDVLAGDAAHHVGPGDEHPAFRRHDDDVGQRRSVGGAAGGAAYGPALTDVVVMAPESRVFVTGPDVVRSVTGEDVDMASLGGPETHHKKSGVCHIVADDELDAYDRGRRLVGLFCQQGHFDRSKAEAGDTGIHALLPESSRRAYDVRPIVTAILDADTPFDEFQANWAPSMVVGLGRLSGRTVGVLANNPLRLGGCLNSESAEKAARFVRLCDAFGIPLVVVVDVPGYLPGVDQEWGGVVRRGAKLLHAFGECTVPRVTLVTRKTYGGAYIAMNSRSLNATKVFAWPDAEVAVMGAKAAVGILHKKKLAAAPEHEREALHDQLAAEHERIAGGVDSALDIGVVDEKIDPAHTRSKLTEALAQAPARRGRHKNIPL